MIVHHVGPVFSSIVSIKKSTKFPGSKRPFLCFCDVPCKPILKAILVSNLSVDGSILWLEFCFFQCFFLFSKASARGWFFLDVPFSLSSKRDVQRVTEL